MAELNGTSRTLERDRLTRTCDEQLPAEATPGMRYRAWERRGASILLAHPLTYAHLHLKGMLLELFGPDRDNLTRLIYGRRVIDGQGGITDESIRAARSDTTPALEVIRGLALVLQGLIYLCLLLGIGQCVLAKRWRLLGVAFLVPAYVLLLSGGPEASPRFRVIYLPMLSLLTGVGLHQLLSGTCRSAAVARLRRRIGAGRRRGPLPREFRRRLEAVVALLLQGH
jgi:hypothetical protein